MSSMSAGMAQFFGPSGGVAPAAAPPPTKISNLSWKQHLQKAKRHISRAGSNAHAATIHGSIALRNREIQALKFQFGVECYDIVQAMIPLLNEIHDKDEGGDSPNAVDEEKTNDETKEEKEGEEEGSNNQVTKTELTARQKQQKEIMVWLHENHPEIILIYQICQEEINHMQLSASTGSIQSHDSASDIGGGATAGTTGNTAPLDAVAEEDEDDEEEGGDTAMEEAKDSVEEKEAEDSTRNGKEDTEDTDTVDAKSDTAPNGDSNAQDTEPSQSNDDSNNDIASEILNSPPVSRLRLAAGKLSERWSSYRAGAASKDKESKDAMTSDSEVPTESEAGTEESSNGDKGQSPSESMDQSDHSAASKNSGFGSRFSQRWSKARQNWNTRRNNNSGMNGSNHDSTPSKEQQDQPKQDPETRAIIRRKQQLETHR